MRQSRDIWFRMSDGSVRHFAGDDYRSTYEAGEWLDGLQIEREATAEEAEHRRAVQVHAAVTASD